MTDPTTPDLSLDLDFPAIDLDDWRAAAEPLFAGSANDGHMIDPAIEGVVIQPLYTAADVDPVALAAARPISGRPPDGWTIAQRYDHPDIAVANRQILADLERGAGGIWLRLDRAARLGLLPDHPSYAEHAGIDGIMAATAGDIERLLDGVHLEMVHVAFDAGAAAYGVAEHFRHAVKRRGLAPESVHVAFNCDPLGTLAAEGRWPGSLADGPDEVGPRAGEIGPRAGEIGDLVGLYNVKYPHARVLGVSTLPYHNAGAHEVQELAYALATAVVYLRALAAYGWDAATACSHVRFIFGIGNDFLVEIAKLRAARRLWARVTEALGDNVDQADPMEIHAVTSPRALARQDPWVNLVRVTVQAAAAGIGGANRVTTLPFDAALGLSDNFARRLALHTQSILQAESHLHRVADAAGGSYAIEKLTDTLARRAWALFQEIERAGGMARALRNGGIQAQVAEAAATRRAEIAAGRRPIIGVTEYPPPADLPSVEPAAVDVDSLRASTVARYHEYVARQPYRTGSDWPRLLGWADAESGPGLTIEPLVAVRDAEPFENAAHD